MIMWIPYQIIRGHKDFWHLQASLFFWVWIQVWTFGQNVKMSKAWILSISIVHQWLRPPQFLG